VSLGQAALMGLLQGLTEFLPVSSSGHLVLMERVLGIDTPGITFLVVVHLGTLVAVLAAYHRELRGILVAFMGVERRPRGVLSGLWHDPGGRLGLLVLLGTLPTAVIALTFKPYFEALYDLPLAVGVMLLFTGFLLWSAHRAQKGERPAEEMRVGDALVVGFFQGLAIAPGVSRSAATIAAGLRRGLDRELAAGYSFLLSIPAITGAALLDLADLLASPGRTVFPPGVLLTGFVVSAVSGFLAIKFLLGVVKGGRIGYFAYYCWFLGLVVIIWQLLAT